MFKWHYFDQVYSRFTRDGKMAFFTSQTRPLRRETSQRRQPEVFLAVISLPLAVTDVCRRRILSRLLTYKIPSAGITTLIRWSLSRRRASEAQREKELQRDPAREEKAKETFFLDCKTVGFFLKTSKEKLPSLTLHFQPRSRPFVWLLALTWIRKNTDCFAV